MTAETITLEEDTYREVPLPGDPTRTTRVLVGRAGQTVRADQAGMRHGQAPEAPAPAAEPARNASTDEWAAYAASLPDVDQADVDGKTRTELIELYGQA